MLRRAAWLVAATAVFSLIANSQTPVLHPNGQQNPVVPTVTFKLDWPGAEPEYYALSIDSTRTAAYESRGGSKYLGVSYSFKFTASDAARDRIFEAARDLNYFNGNFDYRKGKIAFTGTKTLSYADPDRQFETSYNWSENKTLRQLTEYLQGITASLEFGRSLDYLYRHDKLGLNAELKRMDEMAAAGQLAELQALGPLLEKIAGDSNVMEIARQKARRLLQRANASAPQQGSQSAAQR
jgi:hypothetical protein